MRVGTLEIQIMAGLARLQKDMNDAQRIVGGAMGNVEKSVASAKRAMQALGVGLPLAAITDQVRRMTDQYTKLDAQLRLSTKSQAQYAQGMADIRRISTVAQADLSSTAMLYTRLMNVMQGTGVSQAKLATVTETVSFGLKAYGATAQEASSAALQLSQAMGANRLGGEEFRAVMEAMPNVMKVLADSMGVPLGSLRQLSIEGKITADEMVKAFGNPVVAAQFKAMADGAQTITGAWIVARNELMLLIGEFMKSSGATSGAIAAFNGVATVIRFLADNLGVLLNVLTAYVTVMGGKLVVGLVQARMAQAALTAANIAAAESALFAAKANLAGAAAAARAGGSAALASTAMKEYAAASAAMAAASASSFSRMGAAALGFVGGPIGALMLAITAAIATIINLYDTATTRAEKFSARLQTLSREELQMERQKIVARIADMEASKFRGFMGQDIAIARSQLGTLDKELAMAEKVVADKAVESQIARDKEWERLHATRAEQRAIAIRELGDEYVKRAAAQGLGQEAQIRLAAEFNTKLGEINAQFSKTALREEAKAQKEMRAMREASIKYEQDIVDGINTETDALLKKIEQERFDTEAIGKTKEQLALLQSVRYDNVTSLLEQKLATLESVYASEAEIAAIRDQIKARKELKGVWEAQATAQAADAQGKVWKEIWDSVDKTAHDTFVSILNGGKDTATRLREAFKNGFFDWLYSMTLKKWIINIGTSAAGAGVSGAAMAGTGTDGGIGGIGNWMSVLKTGFGDMAASFTSMAGTISGTLQGMGVAAETAGSIGIAGAYAGAGLAGITLGSMLAGNKKFAGMGGTTTSALGAGLGALAGGPLGALVGGALGGIVNAAFGRGPKVSGTTTLAGQFGMGGFAGQYQTPWSQSGGWFSSGRSGIDVTPLTVAQAKALNSIVAGGKSVFDNLTTAAGEAQKSLVGWTFAIDRQVATQEQQNQLIIDLSNSMGTYLIPQLVQFRLEGENLADTAVRMRDTFVVTDAILGIVGQTFNAVGLASMQMRSNLVGLLGGVQQANTSMQAYYQAFFTEEERTVNAWRQMAVSLRQLGVTDIPTTNAQFRALIEAQDLNTVSGQETFAALISLSSTFDSLTRTTSSLTSQTTKLATNLNLLATSSFVTLVDYTRYVREASTATPATNDAFMQQVQQVLASAPAAAPQTVVPFAEQAAQVVTSPTSVGPNPANVAAKAAALTEAQMAQAVADTSNSGRALRNAEAAWAKYNALPAFAGGGTHTGGLRLVGENGPELEYTGPSTIFSNGDTRNMLDNSGVIASVDALREELRALGMAIAAPIQKSYKVLDRWDGDGMPEVREAA